MHDLPDLTKTFQDIAAQLSTLPLITRPIQIDITPLVKVQQAAQQALVPNLQPMLKAQQDLAKTMTLIPKFEDLFGLQAIYRDIAKAAPEDKRVIGTTLKQEKQKYLDIVELYKNFSQESLAPIDVTAPFDLNVLADKRPGLLPVETGSQHPLMRERQIMLDIFYRMGFTASESREIDDDFHMFGALNFPEDHPARDDYDTFMTVQTDAHDKRLIAPAHTSTMQNRLLKQYRSNLENGEPIAVLVPDRVFRNEDLDARHEHTFYQFEGVYVDKNVNVGMLVATLKEFLESYYGTSLEVAIQPFYFPFTEPSFEFSLSCPFCQKAGCSICSQTGWIELLGCGMIHPNVLRHADINPEEYTGFAWGGGIDRLVMMKYGIEDVRLFQSGKLNFLRQFS